MRNACSCPHIEHSVCGSFFTPERIRREEVVLKVSMFDLTFLHWLLNMESWSAGFAGYATTLESEGFRSSGLSIHGHALSMRCFLSLILCRRLHITLDHCVIISGWFSMWQIIALPRGIAKLTCDGLQLALNMYAAGWCEWVFWGSRWSGVRSILGL